MSAGATTTALVVACFGAGLLVGWLLRGEDVDRAFRRGYWSRQRDVLEALGEMYRPRSIPSCDMAERRAR